MQIIAGPPSDFSKPQISSFMDLAIKSDHVSTDGLEGRIYSAFRLAMIVDGQKLVAISAIKNNPLYRDLCEKNSGLSLSDELYLGEFGWLYVCEDDRRKGYAQMIAMSLIEYAKPKGLFATIKDSNKDARRFHERCGFSHIVRHWPSTRGNYNIMLYIKP